MGVGPEGEARRGFSGSTGRVKVCSPRRALCAVRGPGPLSPMSRWCGMWTRWGRPSRSTSMWETGFAARRSRRSNYWLLRIVPAGLARMGSAAGCLIRRTDTSRSQATGPAALWRAPARSIGGRYARGVAACYLYVYKQGMFRSESGPRARQSCPGGQFEAQNPPLHAGK